MSSTNLRIQQDRERENITLKNMETEAAYNKISTEYELVSRRRSEKPKPKISTSTVDRSGGLLLGASKPKRAGSHIGKIRNVNTTEETVKTYLELGNEKEEFIVEKLKSFGQYASFKIGAPYKLLEQLEN